MVMSSRLGPAADRVDSSRHVRKPPPAAIRMRARMAVAGGRRERGSGAGPTSRPPARGLFLGTDRIGELAAQRVGELILDEFTKSPIHQLTNWAISELELR